METDSQIQKTNWWEAVGEGRRRGKTGMQD